MIFFSALFFTLVLSSTAAGLSDSDVKRMLTPLFKVKLPFRYCVPRLNSVLVF